MAIRTRLQISPMFGHLLATARHAIRTGSWLVREAPTNARGIRRYAAAVCAIAVALSLAPLVARTTHAPRSAAHIQRSPYLPPSRPVPYPRLAWPIEVSGGQYAPVAWADIAGWNEDDHLQAY